MNFAEGVYVGYKYYDAQSVPVKYPFGYGLSYTTFSCTDVRIENDGVHFTVTNTGARFGGFVAQVYVKADRKNLTAKYKELKGFKKVFLDAGESKSVFIPFDDYTFRLWSTADNRWEKGGKYEVFLCENCRDVIYSKTLELGKAVEQTGEPISYADYYTGNLAKDSADVGAQEGRRRVVADYSTIIADLKYSKGFVGKVFGFVAFHYSTAKDKIIANSFSYLPLRSLMQFMRLEEVQAEGLIEACNGHFFKGLRKLIFKK
jgi:beta-glucosidase